MLTALVIDDELLAQEELTELLHETNQINVLDKASNAIEGLKKINSLKPDVVFLDIQMPQISGIELLAMLDQDTMPSVVFVTAFDQFFWDWCFCRTVIILWANIILLALL